MRGNLLITFLEFTFLSLVRTFFVLFQIDFDTFARWFTFIGAGIAALMGTLFAAWFIWKGKSMIEQQRLIEALQSSNAELRESDAKKTKLLAESRERERKAKDINRNAKKAIMTLVADLKAEGKPIDLDLLDWDE